MAECRRPSTVTASTRVPSVPLPVAGSGWSERRPVVMPPVSVLCPVKKRLRGYLSLAGSVDPGLREGAEIHRPPPPTVLLQSPRTLWMRQKKQGCRRLQGPIGGAKASRTAATCDRCGIPSKRRRNNLIPYGLPTPPTVDARPMASGPYHPLLPDIEHGWKPANAILHSMSVCNTNHWKDAGGRAGAAHLFSYQSRPGLLTVADSPCFRSWPIFRFRWVPDEFETALYVTLITLKIGVSCSDISWESGDNPRSTM